MVNKINYRLKMLEQIGGLGESVPKLLLHSCCGPCSTAVLEELAKYFSVSIVYYNPNIYPFEEYRKRLENQIKVINEMPFTNKVDLIECEYDHNEFLKKVRGFEDEKEGGARCSLCFELRLEYTANEAKKRDYDFFTTTLSVSPHKNSAVLNILGEKVAKEYGVHFLYGDFKKAEGYKRSVMLAKELDLYRQNYCGCEFSVWEDK